MPSMACCRCARSPSALTFAVASLASASVANASLLRRRASPASDWKASRSRCSASPSARARSAAADRSASRVAESRATCSRACCAAASTSGRAVRARSSAPRRATRMPMSTPAASVSAATSSPETSMRRMLTPQSDSFRIRRAERVRAASVDWRVVALTIGIVGLPNVGKSTLFNALTKNDVLAANYPFATIDPNVGIVNVPDSRLAVLSEMFSSAKVVPATVTFVDIAGIVRGASEGQGLGNKFLSHIREADAICQVVRVFDDPDVTHVDGRVDPGDDIATINTELVLADIQTLDNRLAKLEREARMRPEKRTER